MTEENLNGLSIKYNDKKLQIINQQKLPDVEEWLTITSPEDMIDAIKGLKTRGAPLIGVSAAISLALFAQEASPDEVKGAEQALRNSRPTAVNLMNALDRLLPLVDLGEADWRQNLWREAVRIFKEDVELCHNMATRGADLVDDGEHILTHCNTGGLATAGVGTALGVIQFAHKQGKNIHVYVDETRPLLQGGRLTTWELEKLKIPYTLICDNMAGTLMREGKINRVFVGADRIATNGDFANKIGTYSVAVLAKHHGIPFHPVAPVTTIDFECATGAQIPIEERKPEEVQGVSGSFGQVRWSPKQSNVYNPAFDVTPVELVTSLVLDTGVYTQSDMAQGQLNSLTEN